MNFLLCRRQNKNFNKPYLKDKEIDFLKKIESNLLKIIFLRKILLINNIKIMMTK